MIKGGLLCVLPSDKMQQMEEEYAINKFVHICGVGNISDGNLTEKSSVTKRGCLGRINYLVQRKCKYTDTHKLPLFDVFSSAHTHTHTHKLLE